MLQNFCDDALGKPIELPDDRVLEGKSLRFAIPIHNCCKVSPLSFYFLQGIGSLIQHQIEDSTASRAFPFKMSPDHGCSVVAQCFGKVTCGEAHKAFPDGNRGSAGVKEECRRSRQFPFGSCLFIQAEGSHAINDIFEMRGNGEIPDRCCKDETIGLLHVFLEPAEIIFGCAVGMVVLKSEVLDLQILKPDFLDMGIGKCALDAFQE